MYGRGARYYDAIYSFKDYAAEAARLVELVRAHSRRPAKTLLDVACGTGAHLAHLRGYFDVEGVDIRPEMVSVARERLPGIHISVGDMVDFDLGRTFDVVTCLFNAIGYVRTVQRLRLAIASMAQHVNPGGLLIVEPWLHPEQFRPGQVHSLFVEQPDLCIARMHLSSIEDGVSILHFHYMVGTPDGVEYWEDRHELGLFSLEQYAEAFRAASVEASYDEQGLWGRGLHVGLKRGSET